MGQFTVGDSVRIRGRKRQQVLQRLNDIVSNMDTLDGLPLTDPAQHRQATKTLAADLKDLARAVRKLVENA